MAEPGQGVRPSMSGRDGLLYMKVGTHANEPLDAIIERKQREIDEAGFALWGYGGSTCHPTRMVQPFADQLTAQGLRLVLAMEPMNSKHFAARIRASELSKDGVDWEAIPAAINALGSRYALVIRDLRRADEELPLGSTRVAVGPSSGRVGDGYVRGRVDKACLVFDPAAGGDPVRTARIGLLAEVVEPFAVFLR